MSGSATSTSLPAHRVAPRLYGCLLLLYPRSFRARFATGMQHAFVLEHAAARRRGRSAWAAFWLRTAAHALFFGIAERAGSRGRSTAAIGGSRRSGGAHGSGPRRPYRAGRRRPRLRGLPGGLLAELRMALRRLRRSPGFTLTAVVTLAIGMGTTTTIYSVVHAVVLSPLPYPASERLVWVWHSAPGADIASIGTSYGAHDFYRQENRVFDEIAIFRTPTITLTGGEAPERVAAAIVSAGFFDLFIDGPLPLGRVIAPDDDLPGATRVAVISHGAWQRRFGGDPAIVGRALEVNGEPIEIVGVLPAGFAYPSRDTEAWLPAQIDSAALRIGGFAPATVARLRVGVSAREARDELQRLIGRMHERFAGPAHDMIITRGQLTAHATPLREHTVGHVETTLWILLGSVGFVLATACANVVNLLLVRDEGRRREVAVRTALGAGGGRIFRYHASEGLLLGLFGGVLGLALTVVGVGALVRLGPGGLPRLHEVAVDGSVLIFAAALAMSSAVLFGLVPAVRRARDATGDVLREGGRGQAAGSVRPVARQVLIASQVGLATILLIGAGLMVRSFWHLRQVDPGFDASEVLTFRVSIPGSAYPDGAAATRFQRQLSERFAAIDGVEAVGSTSCLPLAGCWNLNPLYEEGIPFEEGAAPPAVDIRAVSAGLFDTLRIPLLSGRLPEPADLDDERAVVVVSRSLAELFWPGEDPLGRRVFPDLPVDDIWFTVVGVVGDVRSESLLREPVPTVYVPLLDPDGRGPYAYSQSYVVRGGRSGVDLAAAARAALRELDPGVPVAAVMPMSRLVAAAEAPTAFTMILLIIAGSIALVLGAVGVYGVLSYVVGQRAAEIGVRMALGAEAAVVRRMVLRQGLVVAALGLVTGLGAALLLTRAMTAVLFGVGNDDALTYAGVAALLLVIAFAASYLPARRASALDPVDALRA